MRKHKHGANSKKLGGSTEEEAFNLGYFYRTVEEHIESYAAEKSSSLTLAELTERLGVLLRSKAENVRQESGFAELVSQMRSHGAGTDRNGRAQPGQYGHLAASALHVRPRGVVALKTKKGKRTMSKESRERIAAAQRLRWSKTPRKNKVKASRMHSGESITKWSESEDGKIVSAVRSAGQPVSAPDISRDLVSKLSGRTEGAIRQRIARLSAKGVLKQSKGVQTEHGGVPHLMIEAA